MGCLLNVEVYIPPSNSSSSSTRAVGKTTDSILRISEDQFVTSLDARIVLLEAILERLLFCLLHDNMYHEDIRHCTFAE